MWPCLVREFTLSKYVMCTDRVSGRLGEGGGAIHPISTHPIPCPQPPPQVYAVIHTPPAQLHAGIPPNPLVNR